MIIWVGLFWVPWLLAAWLLWILVGWRQGIPAILLVTLLELMFPIPLLRPRARHAADRMLEWIGILSAGAVGGALGVLAARSVLVFSGGYGVLVTATGAAMGAAVLGWSYASAARKKDGAARNESLTGLLFAVFVVGLAVFALARLSLMTTLPDWLFRFRGMGELRQAWEATGGMALLLVLWSAGATFVAEAVRNMPIRQFRRT